jgi:hypothetical protein
MLADFIENSRFRSFSTERIVGKKGRGCKLHPPWPAELGGITRLLDHRFRKGISPNLKSVQ